MELLEAMAARHSVRAYEERPIEEELRAQLKMKIEECNKESGLSMQLVVDEPKAFGGLMAHYGKFSGVKNYVALVGKKEKGTDEKVGYYGEKIALYAQTLGLNSCWVALTYKKIKTAYIVERGEKLYCVLALGYGKTQGVPHTSKSEEQVSIAKNPPQWFVNGVRGALTAPTAMNQQKFVFALLQNDTVQARAKRGAYTRMDLGIAKLHFELAAAREIKWME